MKFNDLFKIWLDKQIMPKKKLKTYVIYKNIVDNHISPHLGEYSLKKLSSSIVNEFIELKKEKGNLINGNGLSKNTINSINSIISVLKLALNYAFDQSFISKKASEIVSMTQNSESNITVFTSQEQKLLENYCLSNKNNYIGITLCLYTGIRIGELLSLTWNDIDFNNNILSITKTVSKMKINEETTIYINTPKTKSSIRMIPIPKQLIPYLKKIKRENKSKYVITTRDKGIVDTRSYQKLYERILKRLNISYRKFHTLRHTFATNLLMLGIDVKDLSELLGHSNPMITLKIYSHTTNAHKCEYINRLGKQLAKSNKKLK